jgi:hypothetical protein
MVAARDDLVNWPDWFDRAVAAGSPLNVEMKEALVRYITNYKGHYWTQYPNRAREDRVMAATLGRLAVKVPLAAVAVAAQAGQLDDGEGALDRLLHRPPPPRLEDVTPREAPPKPAKIPAPKIANAPVAKVAPRSKRAVKATRVPATRTQPARRRPTREEVMINRLDGLVVTPDDRYIFDDATEAMIVRHWRKIVAITRAEKFQPPATLASHLTAVREGALSQRTRNALQAAVNGEDLTPFDRSRIRDLAVSYYGVRPRARGLRSREPVIWVLALWAGVIE